jgi:perosamine synthetase
MYPVCLPSTDENEKKYLLECIESGWISSDGPFVKKFEEEFSKYIGTSDGVAICNGTAALEAAVFALDIKFGDEVIMPSFTIISCAIAVRKFGGIPVLVDIEPITWNIDVKKIEERITKKTKAIMVVHMYGHPSDMDPILELAKQYDLKIIEDSSQVHGAEYKGKKCGTLGDISTFSFYANKIITTGEGGMVLTNNKYLAEKARSYRNLCFKPEKRFYHTEWGNNLRMTNMQAAIGVAQLEKIEKFIALKRRIGEKYLKELLKIDGLKTQVEKTWAKSVYWMYCVQLDPKLGIKAEEMINLLMKRSIQCRPFFMGLHQQPIFEEYAEHNNIDFPVTVSAAEYGFYLPSSVTLTEYDIEKIVGEVKIIIERKYYGKLG